MEILLFGITRDIVGRQSLRIEDNPALKTVADLKRHLFTQYPGLEGLKSLAIAVDSEYAQDDQLLAASQEVALIPPVSGG
jgi:sulfur-carrier protein